MKRAVIVFLVFALLGLASAAIAQTPPVNNPSSVAFDHIDWQTASKYEGGYFAYPAINGECSFTSTPGANPTQTDDLGKPATTTGVGITTALRGRPKGCYLYKIRALDTSGLWSEWSEGSDPFLRRPVGPGKPAVK